MILGAFAVFSVPIPALGRNERGAWPGRIDWGLAHGIIVRVLGLIVSKSWEGISGQVDEKNEGKGKNEVLPESSAVLRMTNPCGLDRWWG